MLHISNRCLYVQELLKEFFSIFAASWILSSYLGKLYFKAILKL